MCGTVNEKRICEAVATKDFVVCLFECGMLAHKTIKWLAASSDGMLIIDVSLLDFGDAFEEEEDVEGNERIASLEAKSFIEENSIEEMIGNADLSVVCTSVTDDNFTQ